MTRREKALKTKDKLYQCTLNLINERGYENVLIEDITKSAGLAKGTYYSHFKSKERLLFYTYKKSDDFYLKAYDQVKDQTDFFDQLNSFILLAYADVEQLGKEVLKALCVNLFSAESKKNFLDPKRGLYQTLSRIIEQGKETGRLDQGRETAFYVQKIIVALLGIESYWSLAGRNLGLPAFAAENVMIMVKGLSDLGR